MLQVSSTDFQMHCSKMMKLALEEGGIVITRKGIALLKVLPVEEQKKDIKDFLGCMKGTGKILGDIMSPVVSIDDFTCDEENFFPDIRHG